MDRVREGNLQGPPSSTLRGSLQQPTDYDPTRATSVNGCVRGARARVCVCVWLRRIVSRGRREASARLSFDSASPRTAVARLPRVSSLGTALLPKSPTSPKRRATFSDQAVEIHEEPLREVRRRQSRMSARPDGGGGLQAAVRWG